MADLFSATAPLALRLPDGSHKPMAECFPHPKGLFYLDIFRHRSTQDQAAHVISGELRGEGPWRIDDCVMPVPLRFSVFGVRHSCPREWHRDE